MGQASRWLRSIFTKSGKDDHNNNNSPKSKTKWIANLLKSCGDNSRGAAVSTSSAVFAADSLRGGRIARDDSASLSTECYAIDDDYSHAKAVAAATVTAAEAAVLAAQAAAKVVRLTRSGRLDYDPTRRAAVAIQSVFRGYLARRALRALRALVRLQALVRGYIVRKRAVDQVRRMHALMRAQERARTFRLHVPASSQSCSRTSHSCILETPTPENAWNTGREQADKTKKNTSASNMRSLLGNSKKFFEEKVDKIVEVDISAKPCNSTKNKANDLNINQIPATPFASEEFYLHYAKEIDRYSYYTAESSPRFHTGYRSSSAKRVRGSFAPAHQNDFSGYSDHPNYMGYTKSSKAKSRSLSAPKQRTHLDRSSSLK